jgi:hypothetical protein
MILGNVWAIIMGLGLLGVTPITLCSGHGPNLISTIQNQPDHGVIGDN